MCVERLRLLGTRLRAGALSTFLMLFVAASGCTTLQAGLGHPVLVPKLDTTWYECLDHRTETKDLTGCYAVYENQLNEMVLELEKACLSNDQAESECLINRGEE